jgi:hypothetical protein
MKKTELRDLIRKNINEVLKEEDTAFVTTRKGTTKAISYKNRSELNPLRTDSDITSVETDKGERLKEMARTGINYTLTPDWEEKLKQMPQYGREKPMKWIQGIIDYIKEKGPSTIPTIAKEKFGKTQLAIADYYRAMIKSGVLTPEDEKVIPQFQREPVEKDKSTRDAEDYFVGSGIEFGEEEPETPTEEPEVPAKPSPEDLEKMEPADVSPTSMSEEDYQAWIKYDELKQRLAATKSNLMKIKRSGRRRADADDLSDTGGGDEISRLTRLKKSLEDRINSLVASSTYLQAKIAQEKEQTKKPESPSIEDVVDDLDEGQILDEWTINKWKYYAGIKK